MDRELRNELTMDRILSPHMVAGDTAYKQPSRVCLNFLGMERITNNSNFLRWEIRIHYQPGT